MTTTQEQHLRLFGVNKKADFPQEREEEKEGSAAWQAENGELAGSKSVAVPILSQTDTCGETQRLLLRHPEAACAVVCDDRGRPVGLVMSDAFFIQMNAEFDPEHLYELPISRLMGLHPLTVDAGMPIARVLELAAARSSRTRRDAVIVTKDGALSGAWILETV
ncbi:hypothetical protein CDO73_16760 [Saccharibacillus sp. O23]|uniref:hypothetical protein n=1 Tax=Saccharibacillus sp. O23 TaxID=2009338 RepID=UPI000B4E4BEB|nr:hypothetical protein [Saccharibacillus sp. O23]OWR28867.1 hypothetical protein CDO73_16760 [Saccharibacillus sp. O23]